MKKFNKAKLASLMAIFALGFTTFARYPSSIFIFGEAEELLENK